jgi:acyl dehydratase
MFFEEFEVGREMWTGRRTVTETDLDAFLELSWLDNPIFKTKEGAALAGHPGRIIPGPMQLMVAMGLCQGAGLFDHVIAVLEFERLTFHQVARPGDELKVKVQVETRRPTSRPERGLVVLAFEMKNQREDILLSARAAYLMRSREESTGRTTG